MDVDVAGDTALLHPVFSPGPSRLVQTWSMVLEVHDFGGQRSSVFTMSYSSRRHGSTVALILGAFFPRSWTEFFLLQWNISTNRGVGGNAFTFACFPTSSAAATTTDPRTYLRTIPLSFLPPPMSAQPALGLPHPSSLKTSPATLLPQDPPHPPGPYEAG